MDMNMEMGIGRETHMRMRMSHARRVRSCPAFQVCRDLTEASALGLCGVDRGTVGANGWGAPASADT